MISTCHECRYCYWKYKRDWESPGFCSWLCRELWRSTRFLHHEDDPGIPVAILELITSHNLIVHAADPQDWPDCTECERLDALYAAAIAYHSPATEAQKITVTEFNTQVGQSKRAARKAGEAKGAARARDSKPPAQGARYDLP